MFGFEQAARSVWSPDADGTRLAGGAWRRTRGSALRGMWSNRGPPSRRCRITARMADAQALTVASGATGPDQAATEGPLRELRGVVERITFQNAENGFTVARLAPERPEAEAEAARGGDRLVTVVGTLADLTPGVAIVARGWWGHAPKHRWQFLMSDCRAASPATLGGSSMLGKSCVASTLPAELRAAGPLGPRRVRPGAD